MPKTRILQAPPPRKIRAAAQRNRERILEVVADAAAIAVAGVLLLRRVSMSAGVRVQGSGTEIKNRKIHT